MTRRNVALISIGILVAAVVGGIIGWAAFPREREVVKEVEVIKEVPKEVTKEVPMTLPALAQAIQEGEIDVGTEFGMEIGKRYHNIHADTLGLECNTCHISEYAPDYIYQRKYKVPVGGAPGPVDRGGCLGCHKENGPAITKLFGTAED